MYCQVIISKNSRNIDKKFTYKIPDNLINKVKSGMRVSVDFNNQKSEAMVLKIINKTDISDNKIKYIIDTIDKMPIITKEIIALVEWMREYYVSRYIDALKLFYPPKVNESYEYIINAKDIKYKGKSKVYDFLIRKENQKLSSVEIYEYFKSMDFTEDLYALHNMDIIDIYIKDNNKKKNKIITLNDKEKRFEDYNIRSNAFRQEKIIKHLIDIGEELELNQLLKITNSNLSTIKSLEKKEAVRIEEKDNVNLLEKRSKIKESPLLLNREQIDALKSINQQQNKINLIHGVTGSGKTEIYMNLIEKYIKVNKKIIMLFPEISLTNHMISRFTKRFGNRVAVIHSRMDNKNRYDQWDKINNGYKDVIIGARSALFTPVRNLGAVIIDEEHDDSYNSSTTPKYKTIEVAEKLTELTNSKLILGSATPSINSYYKTKKGNYNLIEIKNRINSVKLPETKVVDMKKELESGNRSIFSRKLYKEIERTLERKEQVILFLNKRGYSSFVSCRNCGYVVKCNRCDVSMTYHSKIKKLVCHYCGATKNIEKNCPECGSQYFKTFGVGTQKIEKVAKELFPDKNIDRMDFDTVTKKGAQDKIYKNLSNGETDILIGTQMLAKGIHFPNVTLVGIISADVTINLPFYTASEKSFQLITQVSGRAGRGSKSGKVILQTYEPDHYSIKHAIENNYYDFFKQEIILRKEFKYPPYIKILYIDTKSKDEKKLIDFNSEKYKLLTKKLKNLIDNGYIKVYKPVPKGIYRINNQYQIDTIIKARSDKTKEIKEILRKLYFNRSYKGISISIEINPNTIS